MAAFNSIEDQLDYWCEIQLMNLVVTFNSIEDQLDPGVGELVVEETDFQLY